MTKNVVKIIATREYVKVVRKKSFWIMIVLIPIFYVVVSVLSGMSGQTAEKKIAEQVKAATRIIVVDQARVVLDSVIVKPLERADNPETARLAVQNGQADAAFIYPVDLSRSLQITTYIKDSGIISRGRFDQLAISLVKQSILEKINDPAQITLYNAPLKIDKTVYANGQKIVTSIEAFILPILAVVIFFILVITSSSYMLMSVSEEKENRMIETMLSMVTPRQMIWGKLIAMVGLAFTQLATLAIFGIIAYQVSTNVLPININWSLVHFSVWQLVQTIFYIVTGFLFMAGLMVGIGGAMPTYREAQQASPLFIITSILPIYFAMALIADPSGSIARITSYVPFMSPLVLTFRASINALPAWEQILGIVVTLFYTSLGFYLAFKLFEIGSLETGKRIGLKSAFKRG